ncbi:hypothetical protein MTBPR1_80169 [Candidatus Terasakiella magnetica]|uniref:Uncharacterized protein n=1 Tax=Candidatus Terasakiella magnetica TaxID=1867952 RepID=A0A1C3RLG2_9PROT|nr:hypothetical protein [Candidatus Terasakiella magnetica]SCA58115.1 hypothetical protein MTBPR1_80169 [Candidatus Terasakiella magnetica]
MNKYSLFEKTQFATIGIGAIIGVLLVFLNHTSLLDKALGDFEGKLDHLFNISFIFFTGLSIGGVLKERQITEVEQTNSNVERNGMASNVVIPTLFNSDIVSLIHNDMRQIQGEAAEAAEDADSIVDRYKKADYLWEYASRALDHDDLTKEEFSKLEHISGILKDFVMEARSQGLLEGPTSSR